MRDYYKTLGIAKTATSDEIKTAYRKLAKKYHPDANPGNKSAEVVFKEVNEAHTILSDETKKAEYDRKMFGDPFEEEARSSHTTHSAAYRSGRKMTAEDFVGAGKAFEDFFGFDPDSDSPELKKKNNKVKPMKTSDAFEAIFGKRKF